MEILLASGIKMDLSALSKRAEKWLGIGSEALAETMAKIVAGISGNRTALRYFAARCRHRRQHDRTGARTSPHAKSPGHQQVNSLQQSAEYFQSRATEFEDKHRRDPLTGVFNRGHLDQELQKEFQASISGGWPLSIVFADLDRFKQVNDTYGHRAGDTVLIATEKLILEVVRDTDVVARYGGEEFVIILPGLATKEAEAVCERLLKSLRNTRHAVAAGHLTVTASLGLATHSASTPFRSVAEIIEAADRSVYMAKKAGRDQLICHESRRVAQV